MALPFQLSGEYDCDACFDYKLIRSEPQRLRKNGRCRSLRRLLDVGLAVNWSDVVRGKARVTCLYTLLNQ